jgi:hypothetical protein
MHDALSAISLRRVRMETETTQNKKQRPVKYCIEDEAKQYTTVKKNGIAFFLKYPCSAGKLLVWASQFCKHK